MRATPLIDTNEYLQREMEHQEWIIKGLRGKLDFIWETVFRNEDGDNDHDLLEKVKDILAEQASTFAAIEEMEEEERANS